MARLLFEADGAIDFTSDGTPGPVIVVDDGSGGNARVIATVGRVYHPERLYELCHLANGAGSDANAAILAADLLGRLSLRLWMLESEVANHPGPRTAPSTLRALADECDAVAAALVPAKQEAA